MLIVVVSPSFPRFDATTHYWQAEFASVVSYLRVRFPCAQVVALPAGLICAPNRIVVAELLSQPDFVVVWSRVFEAPAAKQIAYLTREISPKSKVLIWGDGPLFMPRYYGREPFDAAVLGGDPELVLADAIERMAADELPEHGVVVKADCQWVETSRGRWLDPNLWPFPDLDVIAFDDYRLARELRGKPTDDLSFDVSRGCHVGCQWCVDPLKGGRKDRRRPVKATVDFMARGVGEYAQFQLHGPIFTQDRPWVDDFVEELRGRSLEVPFKAVTLVNHLAEARLVEDLASVGMHAIGFGIETLTFDRSRRLITPKVDEALLEKVAKILRKQGVEGKAYTQVGLRGQHREDVLYTHRMLKDLGFTVRPTGSTPFHLLKLMSVDALDQMDLTRWDRKSFFDPECGLSRREFFHLITSPSTFVSDEVSTGKEVA